MFVPSTCVLSIYLSILGRYLLKMYLLPLRTKHMLKTSFTALCVFFLRTVAEIHPYDLKSGCVC